MKKLFITLALFGFFAISAYATPTQIIDVNTTGKKATSSFTCKVIEVAIANAVQSGGVDLGVFVLSSTRYPISGKTLQFTFSGQTGANIEVTPGVNNGKATATVATGGNANVLEFDIVLENLVGSSGTETKYTGKLGTLPTTSITITPKFIHANNLTTNETFPFEFTMVYTTM